jgi:hypothetical protein
MRPNLKVASKVTGIDLENPINLSEMEVYECICRPEKTQYGMKFELTAQLKGWDFNTDTGETDEITVTIVRISSKRPKIDL